MNRNMGIFGVVFEGRKISLNKIDDFLCVFVGCTADAFFLCGGFDGFNVERYKGAREFILFVVSHNLVNKLRCIDDGFFDSFGAVFFAVSRNEQRLFAPGNHEEIIRVDVS